ncbi:DC1 [Arabidopsis suecica]|uniref:DC1 n=1 Tax=Arabidopsis suecica TaxID=45249 RepID=A0A8T2FUK0_ARASU|nr:DC1 [Arabidopsis suecica]
MGQGQSSDKEVMPRCVVSDPAQPHNFSHRSEQKVKHDCFGCGKSDVPWEIRERPLYYYCTICDLEFHKNCLEYPSKIIHPYHPQHPLVFTVINYETGIIADTNYGEYYRFRYRFDIENSEYPKNIKPKSSIIFDKCTWCGNDLSGWFYRCTICNFSLDFQCALEFPPLTIQNPKSHPHSLALFPRPLSFPCNACGLINVLEPSYACYQCNYVVHQSCIDLPRVIKITRHPHRLSHTLFLPAKVSSCRVCYKNVDIKYGQYSCNHEECFYVVHSKCATHGKIWDGEELEWEDEESEQAEDIAPYKKISGGLIEHCWHQHHFLKLEKYEGTRDSKKQCQACMRPVNPHDFYSCIECEFFIHEVCANLPRKLDHASHNHPLYMDPYPIYDRMHMNLGCSVCFRYSSGLKYRCKKDGCSEGGKQFQVDVNCILVPECFTHESHAEHRLFISTFGKDKRECQGCRWRHCQYLLQCVSCEFAICYTCATIPNELYHKYDDNPLSLCYGEKGVDGTYWCEVCEEELDPMEWFYTNTKQCTTIHRKCILGDNVYMKSGHTFEHSSDEVKVVCHGSSSRPICHTCHKYCPHPVYFKVYMPDGTEVDICSVNCHKI